MTGRCFLLGSIWSVEDIDPCCGREVLVPANCGSLDLKSAHSYFALYVDGFHFVSPLWVISAVGDEIEYGLDRRSDNSGLTDYNLPLGHAVTPAYRKLALGSLLKPVLTQVSQDGRHRHDIHSALTSH